MRRYLFVAFMSLAGIVLSPSHAHADALLSAVGIGANPIYSIATGTIVYTSNVVDHTVTAIDTTNNNATTSIGMGTYQGIIYAFGSKIYAAAGGANKVIVIDPTNGYATSSILSGSNPDCFWGLGTTLYVCNYGGNTVTTYNTQNGATSSIVVGNNPSAIATIGTKLYVTNRTDNTVTVIDSANGNATSTIALGSGGPGYITAFGTKLYVGDEGSSTVSIIDSANGNATSTVAAGGDPRSMVYLSGKVYIGDYTSAQVTVIDTQNGNAVTTIGVGPSPEFLTTYGTKVYVSSAAGDSVYSIDSANGNAVATIPVNGITQGIVTVGSKVYAAGQGTSGSRDYVIDVNTVPATLTEVTPVPTSTSGNLLTYVYSASYPTGEQEVVLVGSCNGVQVQATQASNTGTSSLQLSNYSGGTTFQCTLKLQDGAGNLSNILNVGPFLWSAVVAAPSSSSGGISEGGRQHSLAEMVAMGLISPETAAKYGISMTSTSSTSPQSSTWTTPTVTVPATFTKSLKLGMTDPQVVGLQQYLNAQGFTIASSGIGSKGKEATYFGTLTQKALIAFQKAKGITPASGYFGTLTRAYVAAH